MKRKVIEKIEEHRFKLAKVVSTMNNKGGCAKTTTSIAFGLHMVRLGKNVLFVDADQQSNMSQRLGLNDSVMRDNRITTLMRLSDMENVEKEHINIPLMVQYPYLYRVKGSKTKPGMIGLLGGSHNAELEATAAKGRIENSISRKFASLNDFFRDTMVEYKKYFDYIIIDTAPALEGNVLNQIVLAGVDEIICPVDGLEAALGLSTFLNWVETQGKKNKRVPNVTLAMVKYQMDTSTLGDTSGIRMRNSVYRSLKETFGNFVCENGVKEKRLIRHTVQGFTKTDYMDLSNELNEKFSDQDRENIFDVIGPDLHDELISSLSDIEDKTIRKKPVFRAMSFK